MLLILPAIFFGCKKDLNEASEVFYFKGSVDNKMVNWRVKEADRLIDTTQYFTWHYYSYSEWDTSGHRFYDVSAGTSAGERKTAKMISVIFLKSSNSFDINQLKLFFKPGAKTFGRPRASIYDTTTDGILIRYSEDGHIWKSDGGDQSGSTFEVVEFKDATFNQNLNKNVWRARFSCTLYFDGLPPKILSDCEIFGPVF